jgi:transcriptional regulator with XRE-family HTH domain
LGSEGETGKKIESQLSQRPMRCKMNTTPFGGHEMAQFGELLKEYRLAGGWSLREFCSENGFDAGNYSKLERGRFPAPDSDERIEAYARALGLKEGSDQWFSLFDAAAAQRGRLPSDLLNDDEVIDKLPALFRTIRSEQQSGGIDFDELIERIRKS